VFLFLSNTVLWDQAEYLWGIKKYLFSNRKFPILFNFSMNWFEKTPLWGRHNSNQLIENLKYLSQLKIAG